MVINGPAVLAKCEGSAKNKTESLQPVYEDNGILKILDVNAVKNKIITEKFTILFKS